jgi:hypothetical protein
MVKERVNQAECVVAHQTGRVEALHLILTPVLDEATPPVGCRRGRCSRSIPGALQSTWRHSRGLEPRSSLPAGAPPCPKQRSATVASGQRRSPSEAPDLFHCRTANSPTMLPKLAVARAPWSALGPHGIGSRAELNRRLVVGRASYIGPAGGKRPPPTLGSPAATPISTPYSSRPGSASRARRTSWVGMVIRGVRGSSMLIDGIGRNHPGDVLPRSTV